MSKMLYKAVTTDYFHLLNIFTINLLMEHLGRRMVTAHAIWLQGFDNVNWSDSSWRPLLLVIPVFSHLFPV